MVGLYNPGRLGATHRHLITYNYLPQATLACHSCTGRMTFAFFLGSTGDLCIVCSHQLRAPVTNYKKTCFPCDLVTWFNKENKEILILTHSSYLIWTFVKLLSEKAI